MKTETKTEWWNFLFALWTYGCFLFLPPKNTKLPNELKSPCVAELLLSRKEASRHFNHNIPKRYPALNLLHLGMPILPFFFPFFDRGDVVPFSFPEITPSIFVKFQKLSTSFGKLLQAIVQLFFFGFLDGFYSAFSFHFLLLVPILFSFLFFICAIFLSNS